MSLFGSKKSQAAETVLSLQGDLPRGSDDVKTYQGPNAKFVPSGDVLEIRGIHRFDFDDPGGSIFLGVLNSHLDSFATPRGTEEYCAVAGIPVGVTDDRHMITVAGTRAGKGRSCLVPNLATYDGSLLAIDPKGDLAKWTADWRHEHLHQQVVVMDPFGVTELREPERYRRTFNPVAWLTLDNPDIVEDAGLIADAIIVPDRASQDPHWNESAKQFLESVILHVATSDDQDIRSRDLPEVARLLNTSLEALEISMLRNKNKILGSRVPLAAANFFSIPDKERFSIISSLRRHIKFLGYDQIAASLKGDSPLDLKEFKRTRMTIYLSLPALRMGICAGWLRLFVNLTLAAMEREKTKPAVPLLMCLDEFAVLGPMKSLEDAAGQIAGLGCKLWPILQDLGQLKSLYGDRWQTFLGNAGVMQFFGNSDLFTLEYISKRLGETTIGSKSSKDPTLHQTTGGDNGMSSNQQVHPLMTPEEISRYFGRSDLLARQLIVSASDSSIILQRANYDKSEYFARFYNFLKERYSDV